MTGRSSGNMTDKNTCRGEAPSMMAASSISRGMDPDKCPEDKKY